MLQDVVNNSASRSVWAAEFGPPGRTPLQIAEQDVEFVFSLRLDFERHQRDTQEVEIMEQKDIAYFTLGLGAMQMGLVQGMITALSSPDFKGRIGNSLNWHHIILGLLVLCFVLSIQCTIKAFQDALGTRPPQLKLDTAKTCRVLLRGVMCLLAAGIVTVLCQLVKS
ncbi:MAG: hypothetical protein HY922_03325 [Elusimicrobia bacterium]|nr:hypothetical protein [Elusimicrobiota bacterium]